MIQKRRSPKRLFCCMQDHRFLFTAARMTVKPHFPFPSPASADTKMTVFVCTAFPLFIPRSIKLWELSHNLCAVILISTYFSMIAPYLNCKFFVYYKQASGNLAGMIKFPQEYFILSPFHNKIQKKLMNPSMSFFCFTYVVHLLFPKTRCLNLYETAGKSRYPQIPAVETEEPHRFLRLHQLHVQAGRMLPVPP